MSEPRNNGSRSIWPAAVVLGAFGLMLVLSALESAKIEPKPASTALTRYQVPVTDSQPSQGPADAPVTIVEWCNFELPTCRAADAVREAVLARHGDQVRWIYRSFTKPSSRWQEPHEFAQIAFEQTGKFWDVKQLLQQSDAAPSRADLERAANALGIDWPKTKAALDEHTYAGHVIADRVFANMFDVGEPPAFFVNGRRLAGTASLQAFEVLIEDEVAHAKKLVASGVPRDRVYAELTKGGLWKRVGPRRN
jgi:protein-disulfide isomerase